MMHKHLETVSDLRELRLFTVALLSRFCCANKVT